jgi:CBS-domain-containing membrane protein
LAEFLASGRAIDCILALMLIELIALVFMRRKSRRGLPLREVLASLCAGAALLCALRAALQGSPWQLISLWLIAALVAHLFDLSHRWKSAPAPRA